MSTIPHEPSRELPETLRSTSRLFVREMWASLAIAVIWLAVLFAAVFGSDLVDQQRGDERQHRAVGGRGGVVRLAGHVGGCEVRLRPPGQRP